MAHVFGPRRGTERSKDRSCMKISPNATTQRMALPFAAVRNSKRQEDPLSSSESNLVFDTFPKKIEEDEQFILKQIEDAWQAKDLEAMFHLIKVNQFSAVARKKVLLMWDAGHYYMSERESGKPLTPLARFRIRERNPPPKNLCPGGRKKSTLPKEATKVLRNWLDANPRPYPTRETKAALAELTGLSVLQVNTWFANSRRRMRGKRTAKTTAHQKEKDNDKCKQPWNWTSPQPWQVFPPAVTSASAAPCFGVCACPGVLPQILAPTSLGSNLPSLWSSEPVNSTARTFVEWPASHRAVAIGSEFLSAPPVVAPIWNPELQYCGLPHAAAAAHILLSMASK